MTSSRSVISACKAKMYIKTITGFFFLTIANAINEPELISLPAFGFHLPVSSPTSGNWRLQGLSAGISGLTSRQIRLTEDMPQQQGAMWSRRQLDMANWQIEVDFLISSSSKNRRLLGDGIAIWYTRESMKEGPVFGSKDQFTGLGVFIDTYDNSVAKKLAHPRVSGWVNDGKKRYWQDPSAPGCYASVLNTTYSIRVMYLDKTVHVFMKQENERNFHHCFTMETVNLGRAYYVGVSASTGELSQSHDILDIRVNAVKPAPLRIPVHREPENEEEQWENYEAENGITIWSVFSTIESMILGAVVAAISLTVLSLVIILVAKILLSKRKSGFAGRHHRMY